MHTHVHARRHIHPSLPPSSHPDIDEHAQPTFAGLRVFCSVIPALTPFSPTATPGCVLCGSSRHSPRGRHAAVTLTHLLATASAKSPSEVSAVSCISMVDPEPTISWTLTVKEPSLWKRLVSSCVVGWGAWILCLPLRHSWRRTACRLDSCRGPRPRHLVRCHTDSESMN